MQNTCTKIEKYLWIGIAGSILALAGDLLLGWYILPEVGSPYANLVAGCKNISNIRCSLGGFLGGLGIPFTFFGFLAIALIITSGKSANAQRHGVLIKLGAYAMAFWGAAVHLLCVAVIFMVKFEYLAGYEAGTTLISAIPENTLLFIGWGTIPVIVVLLMVPYIIACVVMFADIVAGKTILPRWACIFNPLVAKIVLNLLTTIAPNTYLFNGLRMSNMSFGALVTFAAMLALYQKRLR